MAPTPPLQCANVSHINKLPAELFERILLETADRIAPPIAYDDDCKKILRYRGVEDPRDLRAAQALQVRLVCRKFRDMSWRAFGKILGETVFDVGSKGSIQTLQAVAGQSKLAPWVTKLTFTCLLLPPNLVSRVYEKYVTTERLEAIRQVERDERSWFSDFFDEEVKNLLGPALTRSPDASQDFEELMHMLTDTLSHLHNVESIAYFWDLRFVPQRYKSIVSGDIGNTIQGISRPVFCVGAGAHVGLTLIVQALANSGAQPHTLDLAVELNGRHAFYTYASKEDFARLCEHVEQLTLRHKYDEFKTALCGEDQKPTVSLTKKIFPKLRALTLDENWKDLYTPSFLPPSDETPQLTDIAVLNSNTEIRRLGPFLNHYTTYLRTVTLQLERAENFDRIIGCVQHLRLEVLSIRQGHERDWARHSKGRKDAHFEANGSLDLYNAVNAKQFILLPELYRTDYVAYRCGNEDLT